MNIHDLTTQSNSPRDEAINTHTYFEDIGAWPRGGKRSFIFIAYIVGGLLSLALTLIEYFLATLHALSVESLIITIIALACVQFAVQIIFFLHLSKESSARERVIILACTTLIVLILTVGSVWIMFSLNNRMMPSTQQMEQYMDSQAGI
jgi:cytochrome o ubiquinol oxidase operon protein cyoD